MDYCRAFLLFSELALTGGGGVGGGEGVDNVQFCIHRTVQVTNSSVFTGSGQALARFQLESTGFRRGRNFMWFPLRPSTQQ